MAEYPRMTHAPLSLGQILVKIRESRQKSSPSKPALIVFDLDSTLFDVSPRFHKVLMDFREDADFEKNFSQFSELFQKIKMQKGDWGLRDIIERAGRDFFPSQNLPDDLVTSFRMALKNYWIEKFFTNEYLDHDVPYPGAVPFVQALSKEGDQIVYLTGRDQHRMGPGSLKTLQKWDFPTKAPQHLLILKPHKDMDDANFKRDWFLNIDYEQYSQVWFFENEPLNIKKIRETKKPVEIVFFDSTHSRQADPPVDLPWIQHFIWDED